ncbi:MAG: right-handed parallel beta-helix repeat-containing protein, partial [Candidatus Bathyarchaeia archaeon]
MKNVGKVWLIMLLMLVSASFYALKTPNVEAAGTIYIRADGSIDPPTANITRDEFNMTYTFTGNNYDTIVIERSNIILNGAGFTLKVASADGISFQYQSNITIENLNVDAGPNSFGIYAYYSNNITIFGCRVYSSSTGISIYYTSYCKIYGNTIEGNGIGISITGSEVESAGHHNLIYNNTVASNSNHGIYLLGYSNSVYRNNVTGNNRGISIGGNFNNVYENIITRNKYPDGEGISIHSQGGGCNVSYNYVAENTWGIILGAGYGDYTPNTLKGNVMVNNSRINFGLSYRAEMAYLYNDVDTSNTVNGKPVYYWISKENDALPLDAGFAALINCKNITVANLNIEKNLEGIILAYSNNCTIYGNNLTDNGDSSYHYGNIALYHSSNNRIYNNNVATSNWNGHGIVLDHGSSHNTVLKNNITETYVGVYMYYSDFNNVS